MLNYLDYDTTRIILMLILIFIYIFLKYIYKLKRELLVHIIFLCLIIIIWIIPFEKNFIKSERLRDCYDYYSNSYLKQLKIDDNNYFIINKTKKQKLKLMHFIKNKNYWYYKSTLKEKKYKNIKIQTKKLKGDKLVLFMYYEDTLKYNIKDNIGTKFNKNKINYSIYDMFYIFAIIENVPENYYLIINGEKVKI